MKIALVHDYIKEYGGAERVLEALRDLYPDAPVFTTVYLPEFLGPHRDRFKNWDIRTSWFQNVPFKAKLISPLRLLAPLIFKQFNFSEFDVVIVSATGAYSPNLVQCHPELVSGSPTGEKEMPKQVRHDMGKGPVHICYCHTPPRYLYGYETAREWKKNPIMNVIGTIANHFLRKVDVQSAQNVDYFIANSKEVAGRIKKFYKRDSIVIYPPVSLCHPEFISGSQNQHDKKEMLKQVQHDRKKDYYLAGGRLARPKNIDLIIRACRELGVPLKIFGKGFAGYEKELRSKNYELREKRDRNSDIVSRNSNVEFLGEVIDEEKFELMRNAKAYIFAAVDEDFGITPVEAMSVGTSVIAYRGGGLLESVVDGETGVFFNELTVESLVSAIKQLNNVTIKPSDCIKQAQKFSKDRFKDEIREFIESKLALSS